MLLTPQQKHVVGREATVGAAVNLVVGAIVFTLVFGTRDGTTLSGGAAFALDFIPQTFMATFIGSLIPALIASRAVRRGSMDAIDGESGMSPAARALVVAATATPLLAGFAVALCALFAGSELAPMTALAIKASYGSALAAVAAPSAVRAGLRRGLSPRASAGSPELAMPVRA